MAVRKFLDDTGATQLNTILTNKFNTKVDKVISEKTYSNIIGNASENAQAYNAFYYGSVKPDSFTTTWKVRLRLYATVDNNSNYRTMSEVMYMGTQSGLASYAVFNNIYSTSYRPVYYHTMYRLKQAGFNAGYGHALGFSLSDSNNRGDTSLKRTVKIELLEQVNCEVTLNDTAVLWADWTGGNTTNYGDIATYNLSGNGLQETGDADTYTVMQATYERAKAGAGNVYRYNIVTYDTDDKLQGFVNSATTNTGKTKNTATFKLGQPFFYHNKNADVAADSVVSDSVLRLNQPGIDLRYSTNCNKTLTTNLPVYLVGVPNGNTYTLADTWWTQTEPTTEDGKIYILLGIAYSSYQIQWNNIHPAYWYKNGALRLYTDDSAYLMPTGGIPKTDLASDVQTSLGLADTALQSFTETDPTVPSVVKAITSTDISNWNNKQDTLTAGDYISIVNNVIDTVGTTIYPLEDSSSHYIYGLDTGIYVGNNITYKYKTLNTVFTTDVTIPISGRSVIFVNRQDSGSVQGADFCIFEYIHNKVLTTYSANMKIYYGYGEYGISGSKITAGGVHNILDFSTIEKTSNKVTSITSSSTDTEYPSAKAVYEKTLDVYSGSEQIVGTWRNGKPLYQKTTKFTMPTTSTAGNANETSTSLSDDIDFAFVKEAFMADEAGSYPYTQNLPIYRYYRNSSSSIGITETAVYISLLSGDKSVTVTNSDNSYTSSQNVYVTYCYTKSTD